MLTFSIIAYLTLPQGIHIKRERERNIEKERDRERKREKEREQEWVRLIECVRERDGEGGKE